MSLKDGVTFVSMVKNAHAVLSISVMMDTPASLSIARMP